MKKLISFLLLLTFMLTVPSSSGYNPDQPPEPCEMHVFLDEITITYDAQNAPLTPLFAYENMFNEEVNRLIVTLSSYDMYIPRQYQLLQFYLPTRLWQISTDKRVLGGETDISWFT